MKQRRIVRLIGWAFAASLSNNAPAQVFDPPWNVSLLGQVGGWCSQVEVVGQYGYIGEGHSLTILDVATPSSPVMVGSLPFTDFFVTGIDVKGSTVFVGGVAYADQSGLHIVDVSDPSSPRLLTFYPTPVAALGVYVTDDLAYVACGFQWYESHGGFQIIDVSDPTSPTLRGSWISSDFFASRMQVRDGLAYLAAYDGLHIYDVTTPSIAAHLALYGQSECHDVFVRGNLAYTAAYLGLEIVDITSPTAPTRKGRLLDDQSFGLSVLNGLVFLAQPDKGLEIVDATNPSSPTHLGTYLLPGMARDVAVSTDTAFVADQPGGLAIIDVANPSSPTLRATYDTLSDAKDVWVEGDVAYVANGVRGLKILDVSNPRSARILGSFPTPDPAFRITVSGKNAYLTHPFGPLHIVDVTTPSSPRWLGSYTAPEAYDVAVSGGYAYIASIHELQIVDVTDPTSPTLRGSFGTPGWESDVFVSGDLAFVADYSSLQIIDVSNPAAPFRRSSYPAARLSDVFVSDGVAYISGGTPDFACIDVTNPDAPRLLGSYSLSGWISETHGLHVSNGLAYVLMGHLRVLDVTDPTKPTLRGFYPRLGSAFGSDVFASGNLVYLADWAGLRVLQFTGDNTGAPHWRLYR